MDEMTLTLSSPITEEQFDAITDVDFDNTDRIWFHTKHGKDVEFVKRKKGEWIPVFDGKFHGGAYWFKCSECSRVVLRNGGWNFCPKCGAKMNGGNQNE